jgi:hypothetical protein
MAALVLKNVPKYLHRRLKEEADRNRRSMTQQAMIALERGLGVVPPVKLPRKAIPTLKPLTASMIRNAIREGRE